MIIPNTKTLFVFVFFLIDKSEEILNGFGINNVILNNCYGFTYFNRPPFSLSSNVMCSSVSLLHYSHVYTGKYVLCLKLVARATSHKTITLLVNEDFHNSPLMRGQDFTWTAEMGKNAMTFQNRLYFIIFNPLIYAILRFHQLRGGGGWLRLTDWFEIW